MYVENKYTLLYNVIILYIIKNKINLMLSQSVNFKTLDLLKILHFEKYWGARAPLSSLPLANHFVLGWQSDKSKIYDGQKPRCDFLHKFSFICDAVALA